MKRLTALVILLSTLSLFLLFPVSSYAASYSKLGPNTGTSQGTAATPHYPIGCINWQQIAFGQQFGPHNDNIYVHLYGALDQSNGRHCFYAHVDTWTGSNGGGQLNFAVYTSDYQYYLGRTVFTNAYTWYHEDTSEIDEVSQNCAGAFGNNNNDARGPVNVTISGCR